MKTTDKRLLFLLHRATRAAITFANHNLNKHTHISVAQLATLSFLAENPGASIMDIANILDLNKSAASTMVARLNRAKLIERRPHPNDKRTSQIFISSTGQMARLDAAPVFKSITATLKNGFDEDEINTVLRFLNHVASTLPRQRTERT